MLKVSLIKKYCGCQIPQKDHHKVRREKPERWGWRWGWGEINKGIYRHICIAHGQRQYCGEGLGGADGRSRGKKQRDLCNTFNKKR